MQMFVYAWTLCIFSVVAAAKKSFKMKKPMPSEKVMTCEEFGQHARLSQKKLQVAQVIHINTSWKFTQDAGCIATLYGNADALRQILTKRFNPHSVVSDRWLIFYYYGPMMPPTLLNFRVPTKRETSYLHYLFDGHVLDDFDWNANMLLRFDENKNETVLLVERNYKGSYWMYIPVADLHLGQIAPRFPMQLKQTKDNKYIAFMMCEDQTVYIMARLKDVPPKAKITEEAEKVGYVGKLGKSYLYQGSQWMPTGESEEHAHWRPGFSPTERMERAEQEKNRKINELPE